MLNKSVIMIGIACIITFIVLVKYTYTLRDIRINGEIRYCPIVKIREGTAGKWCNVNIDNKELDAGLCSNKLKKGDTIAIRYIKGKSEVVQEQVELWRYYIFFGLESILLIVGIILIIGGFMGKSIYTQ